MLRAIAFFFFCAFSLLWKSERQLREAREKEYVERSARRSWTRFWCAMVRENVWACVQDIREGVRLPRRLRRDNRQVVLPWRAVRGTPFQKVNFFEVIVRRR